MEEINREKELKMKVLSLKQPYAELILQGKKKIELRLYDEKRQALRLGDTIVFSELPHGREQIQVKVIALLLYPTFNALLRDLPLSLLGYSTDVDWRELAKSMYTHYTKEEELKDGVVGIRIELV